jgi:hypothetical protein
MPSPDGSFHYPEAIVRPPIRCSRAICSSENLYDKESPVKELLFGIQTNGIKHAHADPMPDIDTRFRMVKECGVFDYVDKTPNPDEIEQFLAASEKYDLPVLGSGWFYTLGRDEELLESNLALAQRLGSRVHNVQILYQDAEGRPVSNDQVVAIYCKAYEWGEKYGVTPCFEVHVNMWSEEFHRVAEVGQAVERAGLPYSMTLDHSHVIFKMDNPEEQAKFGLAESLAKGEVILDPSIPGNVSRQWIDAGWIAHCHARAAIPNNPKNTPARDEDGNVGRGIQYPFAEPRAGEYHAAWDGAKLEPWKQVMRDLMAYHASHDESRLGQISTEFIPNFDYGENCKYSLFEQSVACAQWLRSTWQDIANSDSGAQR